MQPCKTGDQLYSDASPGLPIGVTVDENIANLIRAKYYFLPSCGQSFKASTSVNYDSRVAIVTNLILITTLES